jgi:hypothetical protein
MVVQLSRTLDEDQELAKLVRQTEPTIVSLLGQYSKTARALWDVRQEGGRRVLTLALSDPWGAAAGDFAPDELSVTNRLSERVYTLIGEMVNPREPKFPPKSPKKWHIEIRDALVDETQLDGLRHALGSVTGIDRAGLQLSNRVQFVPGHPEKVLITDFVIEVDDSAAKLVKQKIRDSGFFLREDEPLLGRSGVRDALKKLVQGHTHDGQPIPRHAVVFQRDDPYDVHLLEVADGVLDLQRGDLEGIGMAAGALIPGARSLVLYLTSSQGLLEAFAANSQHPLFRDLELGRCEFLIPDDRGASFHSEFPQLPGTPR